MIPFKKQIYKKINDIRMCPSRNHSTSSANIFDTNNNSDSNHDGYISWISLYFGRTAMTQVTDKNI